MPNNANIGMPSPSDLTTIFDGWGGWILYEMARHGIGAASESASNSLAWRALNATLNVYGNGVDVFGIDSESLKAAMDGEYADWYTNSRFDVYAAKMLRPLASRLEQVITNALPSYVEGGILKGWSFSGNAVHSADALLSRYNGMNVNNPAAPSFTPTLTAATGGALPLTAAGSGRRIAISFVGLYDQWDSQLSPVAAQVALTGVNNAYTLAGWSGSVPAGVYKIRVWSGLTGGGAGVYGYLKDVSVTPGGAFPANIPIIEPESAIRMDMLPPGFALAMMGPEAAMAYMLCYASLNRSAAAQRGPMTPSAGGILDPSNVSVGLVNGILGYSNPDSSGKLGDWLNTTFTAGALRLLNDFTTGAQGFTGAANGVQARSAAALDANATLANIGYKYFDATHPLVLQTGNIVGPLTLNLALNSVVDLGIPAGRVVQQITAPTITVATTGNIVFEGKTLRTL